MKKFLKAVLGLSLALTITACGSNNAEETPASSDGANETSTTETAQAPSGEAKTIKVGVVGEKNEVWEEVAKRYEEGTGNKIELVKFSDYNQPNEALLSGDIDLNSYQHYKFLDEFNKNQGSEEIVSLGNTMLAPIGIYSNKIKSIDEIEDGARVAIPNDPTNGSRSLFLLQSAGLIKVEGTPGDSITIDQITENPKNLEIIEMDASQTARSLDDTDFSVVNDNYALDAGLKPNEDAIYMEDPNSEEVEEYINIIAARKEDAENEEYKEVVSYYQTEETKKDYDTYTDGAWIPAW